LNWLKFNIMQQEQAGLYCTQWKASPLEHFDLKDRQREKLVRDFQIFLDETLMRPKPTKHEMRSKIRAKYRKEKFGRARSESPSAPEAGMLQTTGGFSGSDHSKSSPSRQVSAGPPEKPREVPILPSLTEEQQQLALQLQTITAQGPFQEGLPSPPSLPSPRGGPWPEVASYEFPLMVYSEQEKQKAWSDISTKLLRSLGFDIAEPEIGVDETNMRNVEEVLDIKFPEGFEFSAWDQDPYCIQAAGILGLELPQSARSMPEGQAQAKRWQRWQRRLVEPNPEPPPGQPATHQGAEMLARVLEWSLRRTQRHFKRLAFKELRLRPPPLDSPKAHLPNTLSSLGLSGLPSPERSSPSSPRKARPLPMKGRPAGDPFPGAVPLPDSYSLGVGKAPEPPGQATPRQGNWAASPKKSERLQANTALPPSAEEGYVGCVAWKYSQNSPSAQVKVDDAEMTGIKQQEQRAANWANYLRTKDPAMLEEAGMAHGRRRSAQEDFIANYSNSLPGSAGSSTKRQ